MFHRATLGLGLLVCVAVGHPLLARAAASSEATTASCEIGCERSMASCERKLGAKGQCSRKKTACSQRCSDGSGSTGQIDKSRRKILCTQRCDLNRSTCDQANGANVDACAAGQKTCTARCG